MFVNRCCVYGDLVTSTAQNSKRISIIRGRRREVTFAEAGNEPFGRKLAYCVRAVAVGDESEASAYAFVVVLHENMIHLPILSEKFFQLFLRHVEVVAAHKKLLLL